MKWEAEGGKGLLWIAIRKGLCERKLLVCENGRFLKQARNGLCKRKFFVREKAVFENNKKWFKQAVFWLRKREAFEGKA